MKTKKDYLAMQKFSYEKEASFWSPRNRNPVVGSYDAHNAWEDYDKFLFKDFDTTGLVALDYGTGPGRNIIKFRDRFKRIDGVDISRINIRKAKNNLALHWIRDSRLFVCDGESIPADDESYDVVFSVITLQHICSYSVRRSIFEEAFRVLKSGGKLCFQMGYGGRPKMLPRGKTGLPAETSHYFDDSFDAKSTNGMHDVTIMSPDELGDDLKEIGFTDYLHDLRPTGPGCFHTQWIFAQFTKP